MTLSPTDVVIPKDYICDIQALQYVEIHARVQGYLDKIYVDEGQFVKKGAPLFQLTSSEYRESVAKAQANLQRAIAESKMRKLNVDRIGLMVDKNVISKAELEVAQAEHEAAESSVREAMATLENAKINLAYTFIRAPFDGLIDRLPFKRGSLINSGTLLTSISNIDNVYAYFKVSEQEYLSLIKESTGKFLNKSLGTVSLSMADGSDYPHDGTIETIEGDFDRETGSIAIRARFPNPGKILKHGASGKVVVKKTLREAILIPQQSTFAIQDKNYVYVVDNGNVAHAKSFQTLERFQDFFVAGGLQAGDRIAADGTQQLRDGLQINPKKMSNDSLKIVTVSNR
jgi:membrane fusion protein (multidrug efflux system)